MFSVSSIRCCRYASLQPIAFLPPEIIQLHGPWLFTTFENLIHAMEGLLAKLSAKQRIDDSTKIISQITGMQWLMSAITANVNQQSFLGTTPLRFPLLSPYCIMRKLGLWAHRPNHPQRAAGMISTCGVSVSRFWPKRITFKNRSGRRMKLLQPWYSSKRPHPKNP